MTILNLPANDSRAESDATNRTVAYDLLIPPIGFISLLDPHSSLISETRGLEYLEWVRNVEPIRFPYARSVFLDAGMPSDGAWIGTRDQLLALDKWMVEWTSALFMVEPIGPVTVLPSDNPTMADAPLWCQVMASVAHDLAFLLVDAARQVVPDLSWYLSLQKDRRIPGLPGGYSRYYRPAVHPGLPGVLPITEALRVLHRITKGRPSPAEIVTPSGVVLHSGVSERAWERLMAHPITDIYDSLLMDPGMIETIARQDFKRGWKYPERPFRKLLKGRPHSAPAPMVVEAVAGVRAAGWFETSDESDAELAASLAHTWREFHDGDMDLMECPEELDRNVIAMDDRRSTYEPLRPDADEVNLVYRDVVRQLARITQLEVRRVTEKWSADLSEARVSFDISGTRHTLTLPDSDRYVSPEVIIQFNAVLPADRRRLWFFEQCNIDNMVITSATVAEREALENRRPVRLVSTPPDGWPQGSGER
jgi:hypothetical protein